MVDIKACAHAERWEDVEVAAHTLKGSSANLGALAVAVTCEVLVRKCANKKVSRAVDTIADIERELSRALTALRSERLG